MSKNRIAVFVDGGNFFFLQHTQLGWWVDPKLLLDWVGQFGEVVESVYYAGYDPNEVGQMKYLKALTHMGYSLITKEVKFFEKEDGHLVRKANMDCDIVADIFCMLDRYDTVYLVSGDADFSGTLTRVKALGKAIKVISSTGFVANEIREVCGSHLIDFNDIRPLVEKKTERKNLCKSA